MHVGLCGSFPRSFWTSTFRNWVNQKSNHLIGRKQTSNGCWFSPFVVYLFCFKSLCQNLDGIVFFFPQGPAVIFRCWGFGLWTPGGGAMWGEKLKDLRKFGKNLFQLLFAGKKPIFGQHPIKRKVDVVCLGGELHQLLTPCWFNFLGSKVCRYRPPHNTGNTLFVCWCQFFLDPMFSGFQSVPGSMLFSICVVRLEQKKG